MAASRCQQVWREHETTPAWEATALALQAPGWPKPRDLSQHGYGCLEDLASDCDAFLGVKNELCPLKLELCEII